MRPRVTCIGGAVVDLKLRLDAAPVTGTSNPATSGLTFGGVARNVAENLSGLGVLVDLVSRVADDMPGKALLDRLLRVGVGESEVTVVPDAATASYVAVLDPDGALFIGVAAMDILDGITLADIDRVWPGRPGGRHALDSRGRARPPLENAAHWVMVDCNVPAPVLEYVIRRGSTDGVPVVVDAVSAPKVVRLPPVLTGVRLLSCTADEAEAYLRHHDLDIPDDERALATRLHENGAAAVMLTMGERGMMLADAAGTRHVPAVDSRPVDVTGAGDALMAGTIAVLLGGGDLDAAARVGVRIAALTVESDQTVRPDLSPQMLTDRSHEPSGEGPGLEKRS